MGRDASLRCLALQTKHLNTKTVQHTSSLVRIIIMFIIMKLDNNAKQVWLQKLTCRSHPKHFEQPLRFEQGGGSSLTYHESGPG